MNSFFTGFKKSAADPKAVLEAAKRVGGKALDVGKGAISGLKSSMNVPLGEHLGLRGFKNVPDAAKKSGGFSGAFRNQTNRKAMGVAVGKALPSAAAGAGYAYAGKKAYDKVFGSKDTASNYGYY
jgi:hypothetical protein